MEAGIGLFLMPKLSQAQRVFALNLAEHETAKQCGYRQFARYDQNKCFVSDAGAGGAGQGHVTLSKAKPPCQLRYFNMSPEPSRALRMVIVSAPAGSDFRLFDRARQTS